MSIIIGMTGKKLHGKSKFIEFLGERLRKIGHVSNINFKDPLIEMAHYIGWDGVKDDKGRRLLQLLGTDVCRECIDEDFWVKKWKQSVSRAEFWGDGAYILCDDIRFNNEARAIKQKGGLIVHVLSPDRPDDDGHASERGIDGEFVDEMYVMEIGLKHIRSAVEEFYGTHIVQS